MARVEWTRQSGEDVEAVVAMMFADIRESLQFLASPRAQWAFWASLQQMDRGKYSVLVTGWRHSARVRGKSDGWNLQPCWLLQFSRPTAEGYPLRVRSSPARR